MKKYLLVISIYNDKRQEHFRKYHSPRNQQYCDKHGFEYIEITNIDDIPESCRKRKIVWWRFYLIKHWIDTGFLKDNDIISQIDADICIVNGNKPFEPNIDKSFAYAIDSCNTHCMGAFTFRITDWTKSMLINLLDENRWQKYKDTPHWKMFHEQACWYSLAGIDGIFGDPKQKSWKEFKNLGWNTTIEKEPIYTNKELYKNVQILPVEWNVTVWEDLLHDFFRFETKTNKREDVIFRHFAGAGEGQWDAEWCNIPLFND